MELNFVHLRGAGRSIVLLHGWSGSSESLLPLGKDLQNKGYNVFVLDLPGFGGTTLPEKPYTMSDFVAAICNFLVANKIEKPILAGHSFGGKIALKLCAENAYPVSGLVAIAASGIKPLPSLKKKLVTRLAKIGGLLKKIPLSGIFTEPARKLFYKLAVREQDYYKSGALRETFVNVVNEHLDDVVGAIKVPVLLLWGEQDRATPLWMGQRLQELIPGAVLRTVPGAQHNLPKVSPEIVADLIYNEKSFN